MYKLVIGLGNPDKKYHNTRHNLGREFLQNYTSNKSVKLVNKKTFQASIGEKRVGDTKIIFMIPDTFMNLSGIPVNNVVSFYKIDPSNIYVIHDDLDIGVGESKIQFDRGPAGHNGVKSIIDNIRSQAFWRIRIGIGHPQEGLAVEDYVLMPFSQTDKQKIDEVIDTIMKDLDKLLGL